MSSRSKQGGPQWGSKEAPNGTESEGAAGGAAGGDARPRDGELDSGTLKKSRTPSVTGMSTPRTSVEREVDAIRRGRTPSVSGMSAPRISGEHEIDPGFDPSEVLDSKVQLLGFSPDCAVAILERYVITVWRRELTIGGLHWARKAFINLRRSKPDGLLGLLMLVDNDCDVSAPPTVRSELSNLLSTYGERIAGFALVYEGSGLRLTMLRGMVTAVTMTSRSRFSTEVFTSAPSAATWVHTRARSEGDVVQPAHLLQAANRLRTR